jgi:hypothetical protein
VNGLHTAGRPIASMAWFYRFRAKEKHTPNEWKMSAFRSLAGIPGLTHGCLTMGTGFPATKSVLGETGYAPRNVSDTRIRDQA